LVALKVENLEFVEQGVRVSLPRSKTDQEAHGQIKAIPYARQETAYCPVRLLLAWMERAKIDEGFVYRRIYRSGAVGKQAILSDGFYKCFKRHVEAAGLNPKEFSPHSLRAGLITSAYLAGKDPIKTKQISGHKNDRIFESYIRDADLYANNAADLF
jgi:integrase